ncbi:hypothetical protein VitviT2T_026028 [Vitis vinifera]|uniref:Uncharacterized protein n=1 Tax=Vitis vinifera TaxID=29760 RepID=A0ABY9DMM8_VITVI|nr:hypothetical protein VitviT2T_026028 [Vitis vinifera]
MMIPIYQTSQVTEELKGTTASSRVGENQKYGTAETMGEGGFWFGEREKPKSEVVNIKRGTGAPPPPRALSQTLRVHEKWEWSSRRPMGMGGWDLMFLHIMRFCKTTTTRPENKVLYIKEGISKRDDGELKRRIVGLKCEVVCFLRMFGNWRVGKLSHLFPSWFPLHGLGV